MKRSISILTIGFGLFACGDGRAAEQQQSGLVTEDNICQLAWEQNEEQLDPSERMGNPFPLLKKPNAPWLFEMEYQGHKLIIIPAQTVAYQIDLENKVLDCEVPVAWKALDSTLQVTFDPQLTNRRQITMINGKPFGSETKGGLYLRHQLLPQDPNDINLAWFLQAAPIPKIDLIQAIRETLPFPKEQDIELLHAVDHLQSRGNMGIQAVAMSVGEDPYRYWATLPNQATLLWPQLRFLPLGQPTAEATVEEAWTKANILDLAAMKLWDKTQKKMVDCASIGTGNKVSCRQVVDDAFVKIFKEAQDKNRDICVHLAFSGGAFSPYFISSFCVDAAGSVRSIGTQAVTDPGFPIPAAQGR